MEGFIIFLLESAKAGKEYKFGYTYIGIHFNPDAAYNLGGETKYDSLIGSAKSIYLDEGVLGFYDGLIPHLISELLTVSTEVILFSTFFSIIRT